MSGTCAAAQASKGRQACTHAKGSDGWRGGPYCNSDDFPILLCPLEAEIQVFADGLSEMTERATMKEFTNFAVPLSFLPELQNSFFLHGKGSPGHTLTHFMKFCEAGNTPKE